MIFGFHEFSSDDENDENAVVKRIEDMVLTDGQKVARLEISS